MYFLLHGEVSVFNEQDSIFLSYPSSTLIGDWPFLTNTQSEFSYKVNENDFAVGFVLDIENYKMITERNILSSQEFFKISHRKIEFIRKINNIDKSSTPFMINQEEVSLEENTRNSTSKFSNVVQNSTMSKVDTGPDTLESNYNKTEIDFTLESTPPNLKKKISDYKVYTNYYYHQYLLEKHFGIRIFFE